MSAINASLGAPLKKTEVAPQEQPAALAPPVAMDRLEPRRIESFDRAFRWQPGRVVTPRRYTELRDAVVLANRLHVVASGHSFNASVVGDPDAIAINLENFKAASLTEHCGHVVVTAEAGMRIGSLCDWLARQGFALETIPTTFDATIGGALANGAHATGPTQDASLFDHVTGMSVMATDGRVVHIADEQMLKAARVGLGALGIILSATFRVVPKFDLQQSGNVTTEAAALANLSKSLREHDHYSWFWSPETKVVTEIFRDRFLPGQGRGREVKKPDTFPPEFVAKGQELYDAAPTSAEARKQLAALYHAKPEDRFGRSDFIFHRDQPWRMHDFSIGVPIARFPEALQVIRDLFASRGYSPQFPLAVRFLEATDKALLAMNAGQDVAVIELYSNAGSKDDAVHDALQSALAGLGGRVHWGKTFSGSVAGTYPRESVAAWNTVREQLDPKGKLLTPWLRKILGELGSAAG